ncbi:MAG: hypothetical protein UY48_C0011G0012 [Candidatus Gottesmanbacteria bacterium GW2011_GWB1_49_7]|uniref:6-hydroxymethylpterin diphosphokinase MptE-like domain-containing protein n=1 Tax=Candidatus Gottesmanbacteria bacterium GW2011_GWB1_49_7 TaxID=1618448 RepID=A0A0G1W1V0_9BACT|nr:MAG: hypothetical protein UY48_C0011G0012 [Candidatus Gottesmanbacteria bacterium GW2011_GWB1_49_7]
MSKKTKIPDAQQPTETPMANSLPIIRQAHSFDAWMQHFMSQTFKIQGPEFNQNIILNIAEGNIREDNSINKLGKVEHVVIVGAGPSLQKNAHLLAEIAEMNKNGYDIKVIATDKALSTVIKYIDPWLVTCLECTVASYVDLKKWWAGIDTTKYDLLTVPYADRLLFKLWGKKRVYFMNTAFNAPLNPEIIHLCEGIHLDTGAEPFPSGAMCGTFSLIASVARGDVPYGYDYALLPGVMEFYRFYTEDEHKSSEEAAELALNKIGITDQYAKIKGHPDRKTMLEVWGLGTVPEMYKTFQEHGLKALRAQNAIKTICFIGCDGCEYVEPQPPNIYWSPKYQPDYKGNTDLYVTWPYFIGTHEIKILAAGITDKAGCDVYNCTEGGITYSKEIIPMTFREFIDLHKKTYRGKSI